MQTARRMQFEACGKKPGERKGTQKQGILIKIRGLGGRYITGIRENVRNEASIETKREKEAGELGIARGTVRDGHIDTGTQLMNAQSVTIDTLLRDLAEQGYVLVDIHWFWQRKPNKPAQRVVVMVYSLAGEVVEVPEPLKKTMNWVWGFCNVWANMREDGDDLYRLDTINLATDDDRSFRQSIRTNFSDGYYSYQLDSPEPL